MNTAQKNRLLMIAEEANRLNNYVDCDVIAEGVNEVLNATNEQEACDAIDYLLNAINYRKGKGSTYKEIEKLKTELLAYESMLSAQSYKLDSAIAYFDREASKGEIVRIC